MLILNYILQFRNVLAGSNETINKAGEIFGFILSLLFWGIKTKYIRKCGDPL